MKGRTKVPISMRALIGRINRKLEPDHERLHRTRPGTRAFFDLGEFYILRYGRGGSEPSTNVLEDHVDLEGLGHKLGVLRTWEAIVE
jgi:hypothetical protein